MAVNLLIVLGVLVAIPMGLIGLGNFLFGEEEAERVLQEWCQKSDLRLVRTENAASAFRSHQKTYRITVLTSSGERKTGLVRCGRPFIGLFSSQITVKWNNRETDR